MKRTLNGNLVLQPTTCCFRADDGLVMIFACKTQLGHWARFAGEQSRAVKALSLVLQGEAGSGPWLQQDWAALLHFAFSSCTLPPQTLE